ncbi:signal peptidase I [bacterium]|nr:signal peptidase I [bacterium]
MKEKEKEKKKVQYSGFTKFRKEWIEPVVIAFVLVFIFKTFFFQNFKIPSGSMEDTLLVGDYLFASKFIYGTRIPFTDIRFLRFKKPRQNDIIIFKSPSEPKKDLIKRCVAVGGQSVEVRDKKVYVDNVLFELPPKGKYIDPRVLPGNFTTRDNMGPVTVPEGSLFMMGDNRDDSNDSRFWGFLPMENVKGKALFLYWSWDPDIPFYNIIKKVRWNRLITKIK